MRETKDITIIDNNNDLKFRLTALSALSLQKWIIKAGVILSSSGLLEVNVSNLDVNSILSAISKKGLSFLGNLNDEKVNDLIINLVCDCTQLLNGKMITQLNEKELDNTFTDIKALIELEKEVFKINFSFMLKGDQSIIQQ